MMVLLIDDAPPRLRGMLSLWMTEVRAGVYVSDHTSKFRDSIWSAVEMNIGEGSALMLWPANRSALGFDFKSLGADQRQEILIDGVKMMAFHPKEKTEKQTKT